MNMKKSLLTGYFLLLCTLIFAGTINKQQARQKAAKLFGKNVEMKLVAVDNEERPSYYVFNAQRAKKGFAIIAGEEMDDDVLGYSDDSEYNAKKLPPQFVYWLECYKEQIKMIREGKAQVYRAPAIHEEIDYLIKTKWDQGTPYNALTPINPATGERFPLTGCVATAMAQVMKYWSSSKGSKGIPAYTYYINEDASSYNINDPFENGFTVVVDSLPPTTFDYDLMKDTYYINDEGESVDAVAKLMRYCGQVFNMCYRSDFSGTDVYGDKLAYYFGFNPNCKQVRRSSYSAAEWDELMYNELKAGRPILYGGFAQESTGIAGHEFIVDGYKDGLFHFNWGWNGSCDGYFKISEANPHGTGSGGSSSVDGYSFIQDAMIGVQPEATEPTEDAIRLYTTAMWTDTTSLTRSKTSDDFPELDVHYSIYNGTGNTHDFAFSIALVKNDNELINIFPYHYTTDLKPEWGWNDCVQKVSFGKDLINGEYKLISVSREYSDGAMWMISKYGDKCYLKLTISNDTVLTIKSMGIDRTIVVNSVKPANGETVRAYDNIALKANVTNLGTENVNSLYLFVDDQLATGVGVNIDPKATDDVLMHFTTQKTGKVKIELFGEIDGDNGPVGDVLYSDSLMISEPREPKLYADTIMVLNLNDKNQLVGSYLKGQAVFKNIDEEYFDGTVIMYLFQKDKEKPNENSWNAYKNIFQKSMRIEAGETVTIDFETGDIDANEEYFVQGYAYFLPYVNEEGKSPWIKMEGKYQSWSFEVIEDDSAIQSVTVDGISPSTVVYDMRGRKVGTMSDPLPKGIYVVKGRKFVQGSK